MKFRQSVGLTFDDVLLVPRSSNIASRSMVDTSTWLVPGIRLAIPIISANMDTVTEAEMAIAMAQAGGIGILHRFMPIERQAEMVRRVKRAESFVVENPITLLSHETITEARKKMAETRIGGLVVIDEGGHLLGMLTARDILFAPDADAKAASVMTGRQDLVTASANEQLDSARLKLHANRIEKLPLVDDEDRVVGLITAQDIIKLQEHPKATKDAKGRLRVGVAVGVRAQDLDRAGACIEAGADVLVVDVAHGHTEYVIELIRTLKKEFPKVPVIGGNVATALGVEELAGAGADAVKVGVGSGSICITRLVTGFGIPQLTAVMDCAVAGNKLGIPIIADGGVRNSGDITKALAAGGDSVMLGNLLAGTDESPGAPVTRDGQRYKIVRGMASLTANVDRRALENGAPTIENWGEVVPEGVEAIVPYRGSVADILHQLVGGLRSGMSYAGARSIEELWQKAEFIRLTTSGRVESLPHNVELI